MGCSIPSLPFNAEATLGALLIGVLISCVLFGIGTLQTYLYYVKFPEDPLKLKILVAFVGLCELGHCICICHTTYHLTIVGYGDPIMLTKLPSSLPVAILFSGMIGPAVQIFFAERVRIVSEGRLVIPLVCWTMSSLRLILSVIAAAKSIAAPSLALFQSQWGWLLTAMLCVGVGVDVIIAISLCYYLKGRKARSMERTAEIIDKIMTWTIQTGLLTTMSSSAMLISFLVMPNNFVWIAIFTFLARLFSNSLLASLNSRVVFRDLTGCATMGIPLHDNNSKPLCPRGPDGEYDDPPIIIKMTQLTEVSTEESNSNVKATNRV